MIITKRITFILSCCFCFSGNAQQLQLNSLIKPSKSVGYIYWEAVESSSYRVNVYQKSGDNYLLVSSFKGSDNYYQFIPAQLASTDLYYTISLINGSGTTVSESDPEKIGPQTPPYAICEKICDGKAESFKV